MKKTVIINEIGKLIYFKNKELRTPVTIDVTDKELIQLKITLKMTGINNYSIEMKTYKPKIEYNKQIIIEELNTNTEPIIKKEDPKTILNKLINEEL